MSRRTGVRRAIFIASVLDKVRAVRKIRRPLASCPVLVEIASAAFKHDTIEQRPPMAGVDCFVAGFGGLWGAEPRSGRGRRCAAKPPGPAAIGPLIDMTNTIGLDEAMDSWRSGPEEVKAAPIPIRLSVRSFGCRRAGRRCGRYSSTEVRNMPRWLAACRGWCGRPGRTGPCVDALAAAGVSRWSMPSPIRIRRRRVGAARSTHAGYQVLGCLPSDRVSAGTTAEWLHKRAPGRSHVTGNTVPVSMGVVPP
ncbi:hypothetical protein FQR65_LT20700 [Abscondita terminalis]|nr:hypothetical protein FQR65_LT20700 [Abscondita terminalis]